GLMVRNWIDAERRPGAGPGWRKHGSFATGRDLANDESPATAGPIVRREKEERERECSAAGPTQETITRPADRYPALPYALAHAKSPRLIWRQDNSSGQNQEARHRHRPSRS